MARHKPQYRCVLCQKVRTPGPGMICHGCAQRVPWLDRGDQPPRRPAS
jgi:predicted amidophosphoribosyltransferase